MDATKLAFLHRFVPPQQPDAPTLLLLHGTGGNEHDLIELGHMLDPKAGLLSPRGQVLENGMPRFFRRLGMGVFDLEDLQKRTHYLADFVAEASEIYQFNPKNVIAVGYSNGANIAASVALLRPETLAAAVLFHAMVPLVPEPMPDLGGKPIFLAAGKFDTLTTPEETERLDQLLKQAKANVELHWEPGNHALNRAEVQAAKQWLIDLPKVG